MSDVRFTDLSISIRAAYNRQHVLNGGRHIASLPAWLCRVTSNEGYNNLIDEAPMSVEQVLQVAALIDSFRLVGGSPSKGVAVGVTHSHRAMQEQLEAQLRAAEAQAERIPELLSRLAAFADPASGETGA